MSAALMKFYTAIFVASIYLCISPTAYASQDGDVCVSEITAFGGSDYDDMASHNSWIRIGYFDVVDGALGMGSVGYDWDWKRNTFTPRFLGSDFVGLYYRTSSDLKECFAGIAMHFSDAVPPFEKSFKLSSGTSSESRDVNYKGHMVAHWIVGGDGGDSATDGSSGSVYASLYTLDPVPNGESVLTQIGLAGTDSKGAIGSPPLGWVRVATYDVDVNGGHGNMGCGQSLNQQKSGSCGSYDYSLYQMRVGPDAETVSRQDWQVIGNANLADNKITDGLSIVTTKSFTKSLSATVSASYTANYEALSATTQYSFSSAFSDAVSNTRDSTSTSSSECSRTFSGSKTAWQYKFITTHNHERISEYGWCFFACSGGESEKPNFTPWDKDFSKRAEDSCR